MGLAALCSGIQQMDKWNQSVTFHALIVDHGAREGSAQEAEAVACVLKKRGWF
jgi:tRNA(Ile)-lysidine synthase TilS/MesJ